ncbi:hypothetical protein FACS1894132_02080 [Clostridia bacterium]|nr:hypothetical protein FACS1894132_02080 [Clostridia bacterium]
MVLKNILELTIATMSSRKATETTSIASKVFGTEPGPRGYAKYRLVKFKGVPREKFNIYLKETEFRFNNRGQ